MADRCVTKPNGDLDVELEGWTIRVWMPADVRSLTKRERARKRNCWKWNVTSPHHDGWEGARKARGEAWQDALTRVPQDVVVRHWNDLPAVAAPA